MNIHVVVIGKQIGPKEFELNGAGYPSYLVPSTRVTAHVQRLLDGGLGEKVLADLEPGERNGMRCGIAILVRELEPTPEDLEHLKKALAPFRRAGIVGFVPDPARTLREEGFPWWDPKDRLVGLLLRKKIKALLFGPMPVALALVVGGVLMIVIERIRKAKKVEGLVGLEHVTPKRALLIGFGQCISMWPGSSRSMCTIVAGQLTGLSTATAAEFSFLLGLPTLGAACVYEALKARHALASGIGAGSIVLGMAVSFFVAWAVIAGFIKYLQRHGLEPFGYYRIVLGVVVFALLRHG